MVVVREEVIGAALSSGRVEVTSTEEEAEGEDAEAVETE